MGRIFEVFVIGAVAFGLLAAFAQFNEMTSVRAPRDIVQVSPPASKQFATTGVKTTAANTVAKPAALQVLAVPLPVRKDLTRPEPADIAAAASVASPAQADGTEPAQTPRSIVASSDTRLVPVTTALMAEETVKAPTGTPPTKIRTAALEQTDAGDGTVSDAGPITTTEAVAKNPIIALPSRNPQAQERRVAALATERATPATSKPIANKRKLRRKASQKRLTRAAKRRKAHAARRAKRSSRPLVRTHRVCDRYGRCQKIMMVRKPRNAREYRQLQRLRNRMIANARRNRLRY